MLDQYMRKSCGRGRQCFETDGNFTDESSSSGSQVVPNFQRCNVSHDTCVLIPSFAADTVILEVCILFEESIGLIVQASVSLMVEHLFCQLEGFIVDFVTSRLIPQHEE